MMAEDNRQMRAALAADTLLTASLQSQRSSYSHRSINSINRTTENMLNEDLIAGARRNGRISNVRRFFCLLVTFDLFFTALVWLICTMIAGESLKNAFVNQVVHYRLTTSLFDIVMAASCRFTVLLLFYAVLHLNHIIIMALSTTLTCAFLIAKVSLFDWSQSKQPAFQGFLIITSFILAWGQAWFFDFRVIPQETAAREWILAGAMDPERAPLIRHLLDDRNDGESRGRVENPGYYYTPVESPTHSDDEEIRPKDVKTITGSVGESPREVPIMGPLTAHMVDEYKNKASDLLDRSYKLLTSDDWTAIRTTMDGDVISVMDFTHGKIMRIEGIINAPASALIDILYENVEETPTWNKHVKEMKTMQKIDDDTDIVYQSTTPHGSGIITPRDFITLRHRGTCGRYHISSGVSIHCPSIPKRKNFVRGENGLVCWATEVIESADDQPQGSPGKCRFTWILNTNLKGWLPQKLIDKSLTTALTEFMSYLRDHVRELTDVTASTNS